jgi:hypothetical protein
MNAMLALILIIVGAGLFAAGFILPAGDVLVWVGGLLIAGSVLGPFMFPAKA